MNTWLFVCADHVDGKNRKSAREVWNLRTKQRKWGLSTKTRNRSYLEKGDRIVFYLAGRNEKVIVGEANIKDPDLKPDKRSLQSSRFIPDGTPSAWVELNGILEYPNELNVVDMFEALDYFRGSSKRNWGSRLNGSIHSLGESDYIRISALGGYLNIMPPPDPELEYARLENLKKLSLHVIRERNQSLIRRKKESVQRINGELRCEACGIQFADVYSETLKNYCEVHHNVPLATSSLQSLTRLSDLSILCANCHRAIHRIIPMPTVAKLAELVAKSRGR